MARNPALLCGIRAAQMAMFPIAVLSVFLQREVGFSITQIMLLQGVFGLTMVLLEFPSGYLADRIGYRRSLIVARVVRAAVRWSIGTATEAPWKLPPLITSKSPSSRARTSGLSVKALTSIVRAPAT